eukprot:g9531.t1
MPRTKTLAAEKHHSGRCLALRLGNGQLSSSQLRGMLRLYCEASQLALLRHALQAWAAARSWKETDSEGGGQRGSTRAKGRLELPKYLTGRPYLDISSDLPGIA